MPSPRQIGPAATPPRAPSRVVIDRVSPEVDGGRFAVKRVVGEALVVGADILCDGRGIRLRHRSDAP